MNELKGKEEKEREKEICCVQGNEAVILWTENKDNEMKRILSHGHHNMYVRIPNGRDATFRWYKLSKVYMVTIHSWVNE